MDADSLIACIDCGTSEMPMDTVLTIKQWEQVCPEGGTLCASCMVKRAAKLPGVMNLTARITFVQDYEDSGPGGKYFQFMKKMDADADS